MSRKRRMPVMKKTAARKPAEDEEEPLTDDEEGLDEEGEEEDGDEEENADEEDGDEDEADGEDEEEDEDLLDDEEDPSEPEEAEEDGEKPDHKAAPATTVTRPAKAPKEKSKKKATRSSPFMIYERKTFKAKSGEDVIEIPALVPLSIGDDDLDKLDSTARCQSWLRRNADRLEGKVIEIHQIKQTVALRTVTKLVMSEVE